jgi:hypothetical protein
MRQLNPSPPVAPPASRWSRFQPRIVRISLVVLGVTAVVVGLFADRLSSRWLAKNLSDKITYDADIENAVANVERLAMLDDAGWLALVDFIQMPAEQIWVSDTARTEMSSKLDQWRGLPTDISASKVQRLAARLRASSEQWDDDTTRFAGGIAQRLLRWPMAASGRSDDFIADLEYLIHRSASVTPQTATAGERPIGFNVSESQSPTATIETSLLRVPSGTRDMSQPLMAVVAPPFQISEDGESPTETPADDTLEADGLNPISGAPSTGLPPVGMNVVSPNADAKFVSDPHTLSNDPFSIQRDGQLIRQLGSREIERVMAAATELRRRGYSDQEVRVAEDAVDPDVIVRRGLIERLPYLENLDTKRWVLWMAQDDDLTVRRQAVMMLATMVNTDPRVAEHLRRIQVDEHDPWIRKRLELVFSGPTALQR